LLPWTLDGKNEEEVAYLISKAFWGQGLEKTWYNSEYQHAALR